MTGVEVAGMLGVFGQQAIVTAGPCKKIAPEGAIKAGHMQVERVTRGPEQVLVKAIVMVGIAGRYS